MAIKEMQAITACTLHLNPIERQKKLSNSINKFFSPCCYQYQIPTGLLNSSILNLYQYQVPTGLPTIQQFNNSTSAQRIKSDMDKP